jgi:hypothetical protein
VHQEHRGSEEGLDWVWTNKGPKNVSEEIGGLATGRG